MTHSKADVVTGLAGCNALLVSLSVGELSRESRRRWSNNTGILVIRLPILGYFMGIRQCNCMVNLKDFPL